MPACSEFPDFYTKLYSLLDRSVLHVRYRPRFFRLLDIFMTSSHLPSTLVASFIKRLGRLALAASPAAIVTVVPFVYNLLKRHPSCMVLVHRSSEGDDYDWSKGEAVDAPACASESRLTRSTSHRPVQQRRDRPDSDRSARLVIVGARGVAAPLPRERLESRQGLHRGHEQTELRDGGLFGSLVCHCESRRRHCAASRVEFGRPC